MNEELLEAIEKIFVRERLFREDFEHRIKAELSNELAERFRQLLIRQPLILDERAKTLIHTVDGQRLILDMTESFMALHLIEHGSWEEPVRSALARMLRAGDVFLDIGANIGVHSIYAASRVGLEGHVIAVEASPRLIPMLRENLEMNGLFRQSKVLHLAVSDQSGGTVDFELFPHHPAMSGLRISEERRAIFDAVPERIKVETKTIDDLFAEALRPPDLVKMDIEGFELVALRGAPEALRRTETAWLVEYDPWHMRALFGQDGPKQLWELLRSAGFEARFVEAEIGPKPLEEAEYLQSVGGDLLLLHPGSAAAARALG